jgi:hypothetical protein
MTFKPKWIEPWYEAANYQGEIYADYYVAATRFFRCNPMERFTYQYIRENLKDSVPESYKLLPGFPPEPVIEVAFQDECLVARYQVLVHKDYGKGLRMADMYADRIALKGYVDPDTVDMSDENEHEYKLDRPTAEPPFNAPDFTGAFRAVPVQTGNSGPQFTTIVLTKKNRTREREAAALARNKAALEEIVGHEVSTTARSLDGIRRRWNKVQPNTLEDNAPDQTTT